MQDLRSVAAKVHSQEKSALIANHELLLMNEKNRVRVLENELELAKQQQQGSGQHLDTLKDIILGRLLNTSVEVLRSADHPRDCQLVSAWIIWID